MRHFFSTSLALGLSFVLALASLDAYLQLAQIQTPMETRVDPRLGPTYIPGKRISRFNEGFFLGDVNAYGYMGPSVPPRRRDAERRVVLVGDSFLLGHTVLPRHHFARTLERLLGEATGETVQALNFGKADFDLQDMYVYFRLFVETFDYDLALFFVERSDLIPLDKVASDLYPVVKLASGQLVIDTRFRDSGTYRFYRAVEPIFTRSAVLRLAFNTYKMVQRGELAGVLLDKFAPAATKTPDDAGPPSAGATMPTPALGLPDVSRAVLRSLASDPRNVLVIQNELPSPLREEVLTAGLPVLDLGAALSELKARGYDPYYWPVTKVRGHWNHAAHQEIAHFLGQELVRQGLLWPAAPASTAPQSAR